MKDKTSTPKYISLLITHIPAHTPKIPMRAYFPANCQVKRCRKILFPFNVYANYRVRAVTACHALRSCAGLQGFRSEIGYEIFYQVWDRVRVSTLFHPLPIFREVPPGIFGTQKAGHCARRSLRRPWKLGLRIVAWSKPRMLCEGSLGKIKFRAFPKRIGRRMLSLESVHYFGASEHYWVVEKK